MMTAVAGPGGEIGWEGALIQRARRGDPHAFERLYREYSGRIFGLCLRMTRDPATAEDCVQETFVSAWRGLGKFEARSAFATWLHRIAVNIVLARHRSRGPVLESVEDSAALDRRAWRPSRRYRSTYGARSGWVWNR